MLQQANASFSVIKDQIYSTCRRDGVQCFAPLKKSSRVHETKDKNPVIFLYVYDILCRFLSG